jgi:DNA-binding beta-propeller fold protein YncE
MKRSLAWILALSAAGLLLPAAAAAKRNLYMAGSSELVAAFDIAVDGNLTSLGTISTGVGTTTPGGAAMTPDGRFLFVPNFGSNNVSGFAVQPDGTLDPLAGSPFPTTGEALLGIAVAPAGDRLYVADRGTSLTGGRIFGFEIGSDGALTALPGSPYPAPFTTQMPGIAPDGKHLYTAHNGAGKIDIYTINADGSLTPAGPTPAGSVGRSISFTPDGRLLYAPELTDDTIHGYAVAGDGSISAAPGPGTLADGPLVTQVSPDGKRVYATTIITGGAITSARVGGFNIAGDGSLSPAPGSPLDTKVGGDNRALAFTPDGGTLYLGDASAAATSLTEFDVAANGSLSALAGSPFNAGVGGASTTALVVTPDQGPSANATLAHSPGTRRFAFDGAGSSDPDGSVTSFLWDFGDGTTATGATAEHTYAKAGVFKASLTVTDNEGCADKTVYTGQTAACNGRGKAELTVDLQGPVIKLSGKRKQKVKKTVKVRAACDEKCTITGGGRIGKGRLRELTRDLDAGSAKTFKLKLSGKARKALARAGGKAKVKLTFSATDGAGNIGTAKRTLKLK